VAVVIIDSHVHVWQTPPEAALGGSHPESAGRPEGPAPVELLVDEMDEHGVDRAVLVQTSFSTWDNSYIAEAARDSERFLAHGLLDPLHPDVETARKWLDDYGMAGFRFHTCHYSEDILTHPRIQPLLAFLDERGAKVNLHMKPSDAAQIDVVAEQYPNVTWLLDHVGGYPRPEWGPEWRPLDAVCDLAAHDNVFVKISNYHANSAEPFPWADVHGAVERVVEAFGAGRCLWGTSYPGEFRETNGSPPLSEELRFLEELDSLSERERALIMGEAALDVWDW
jgi:predicted TIM-barrel fold metal-dependent hydrolase